MGGGCIVWLVTSEVCIRRPHVKGTHLGPQCLLRSISEMESKDDFTFAKLSDINLPITFRMCETMADLSLSLLSARRSSQLEGTRRPPSHSELLEKPELKFHGIALAPYVFRRSHCVVYKIPRSELSDIYVTCQLVADNKPLTIPFRTAFKAFKNGYMYVYRPKELFILTGLSLAGTSG
jgi:hypothetical protein